MEDLKFYGERNAELIRNDQERNDHFAKIDDMVELNYTLPKELSELKHMRNIVSTDPLSAITTGRRTLATVQPSVFIQPLNQKLRTKEMANETEKILLWQLRQAGFRAQKDIIGDVVESALRYDMTAVLTIPIKWQLEGQLGKGISKNRYDAAKNYGGFMVGVENPKNVHVRHSALGLETVLVAKVMRAKDVCTFFGERANELYEAIKDSKKEMFVTLFDSWEYDMRVVYCTAPVEYATATASATDLKYEIIREEIDIPFLPWTIKEGGTSLSSGVQHGYRGLLSPIAHTNMWETQNLARSLAFAEAIAYSAAPRGVVYSYSDDSIRIDYGDINNPIYLKPGEEYKQLNPPGIDENLLHVFDRTGADINKLTGVKNLTDLDAPAGTAFATVNAVIKAATSSLDPGKTLAEKTLAGIMEDMLMWTNHTKETIVGFGDSADEMGKKLSRSHKHIDPNRIFIEVKLSASVPTDKLQKINAASMLNRDLNFSKEDAYKELDVANPDEIVMRWEQEQYNEAELRNRIKRMEFEVDLEQRQAMLMMETGIQQQAQQMQMQQQQQVQQQQVAQQQQGQAQQAQLEAELQGQQGQPLPPSGPQQTRTGEARKEAQSQALQGQGFNPAVGGSSPNEADPEQFLREFIQGQPKQ